VPLRVRHGRGIALADPELLIELEATAAKFQLVSVPLAGGPQRGFKVAGPESARVA
jgi:hypothetical protein